MKVALEGQLLEFTTHGKSDARDGNVMLLGTRKSTGERTKLTNINTSSHPTFLTMYCLVYMRRATRTVPRTT
jgi:hypothetical protein